MEAIVTREPGPSFTRQIATLLLPKEHGSWSLALEPLALGLLVAPSVAGGALAVAAIAGFFLRRPLKSMLREPSVAQRKRTMICVFVLTVIALAGLLLAAKFASAEKLWPLIPAALASVAFAWFDSRNEARAEAAELAGTVAFGILPAAFGALAGWSMIESLALAAVMLTRSVPTVLFVRTYMRLRKGRTATRTPSCIAAGFGFILLTWLVIFRIAPWPAMVFGFLLATRTFWLLGESRLRFAPKIVGTMEMILGVAMVLTLAVAWKFFHS
ncbi:MAG TPA: YwiC-like family protein [Verrucomicrobiae bacterium]|nr:YwiC-like family protein [Verrucomicrobiae bacterium]